MGNKTSVIKNEYGTLKDYDNGFNVYEVETKHGYDYDVRDMNNKLVMSFSTLSAAVNFLKNRTIRRV